MNPLPTTVLDGREPCNPVKVKPKIALRHLKKVDEDVVEVRAKTGL